MHDYFQELSGHRNNESVYSSIALCVKRVPLIISYKRDKAK